MYTQMGIVAIFDKDSTFKIKNIQKSLIRLYAMKGNFDLSIPPHITLFQSDNIDLDELKRKINIIAKKNQPFELKFSSFGYFPSTEVFFLTPNYNNSLMSIKKSIHESFLQKMENDQEKQEIITEINKWSPHCTLFLEIPLEKFHIALKTAQNLVNLRKENPLSVKVVGVEIYRFPPYQSIQKFEFGDDLDEILNMIE